MVEELGWFNKHVWRGTDSKTHAGKPPIRTRWVICNKGDNVNWDIRARLVACELNKYKTDEFYASTPPLEAKHLLLSQLA